MLIKMFAGLQSRSLLCGQNHMSSPKSRSSPASSSSSASSSFHSPDGRSPSSSSLSLSRPSSAKGTSSPSLASVTSSSSYESSDSSVSMSPETVKALLSCKLHTHKSCRVLSLFFCVAFCCFLFFLCSRARGSTRGSLFKVRKAVQDIKGREGWREGWEPTPPKR